MCAGSEIFLRVGRNGSSVRHNSFLWSLAPLRFVLNVKGKIPTLTVAPSRGLDGGILASPAIGIGPLYPRNRAPISYPPFIRNAQVWEGGKNFSEWSSMTPVIRPYDRCHNCKQMPWRGHSTGFGIVHFLSSSPENGGLTP